MTNALPVNIVDPVTSARLPGNHSTDLISFPERKVHFQGQLLELVLGPWLAALGHLWRRVCVQVSMIFFIGVILGGVERAILVYKGIGAPTEEKGKQINIKIIIRH